MAQRITAYNLPTRGAKKHTSGHSGRKVFKIGSGDTSKLWPEEERALANIASGKTKMVVQDGEDFLKELDEAINAKS